ncbi:MAG TPA: HGGxSTG domain-containing protein [Gammaproteobacteria bacterium]|nr:HGGxSTG domain-containing protein [Gammaproteobacteria bacterium]
MHLWYDWRTDTIRFTTKTPKAKRGDWPRCGAHRKRDGQACQARALANGRCKYHGGLSTGPKTAAGKARALANLQQFRSG